MTIRFSLTIAIERHQGIPEAVEHQGAPTATMKSSQPRQLVFPWAED